MKSIGWSQGLSVTADGTGVVPLAGASAVRLLADQVGLTTALSVALERRRFVPVHDRGQVLVDVATVLTAGGEAIADIETLRHHDSLLGAVASPATVWRALDEVTPAALKRIGIARAKVRRHVWSLLPAGLPAVAGGWHRSRRDGRARCGRDAGHRRTRRRSRRRRTSRAGSGSIRSGCGATTPANSSRSGCGRGTRTPTTPKTTSTCSATRSARSPPLIAAACWSGPTRLGRRIRCWTGSPNRVRSAAGRWSTRSDSPSTKESRSTTRSTPCPNRPGRRLWMPTVRSVTARRSPNSPDCSTCGSGRPGCGSSLDGRSLIPAPG